MKKIKILLLITSLLLLTNCSKDDENNNAINEYPQIGTIKLFDNVIELDNQTSTSITQINDNTISFNETNQISTIKVNDYIVGSPSTLCPTGFLRKVISISTNGQTKTFNTQFATLDDIIDECNISVVVTNNVFNRNTQTSSITTSFDVILFDGDLNTSTENDQAKITGNIELTPKLIFELKKKKGERLKSGYIKAGAEFEIVKDFDFICKATLTNFEVDKPFGTELRAPTFLIPGTIIWVTPTMNFSVGLKGSVSTTMKIGTNETSNYKIFKELNNGTFTDIQFEKSYTPSSLNLDFTGNANAEVYLKAKYSLKVFEIVGLNVSGKIYLKGDANVSSPDLTKINYCTKWGLKASTGVDVNVFGSDILSAEIETQLYEAQLPEILGIIPCGQITLSTTPTDGLVAYYPFNGNANDESGNNNNGTVNGATLTTDRSGSSNKAMYFNGNKISISNSTSLQFLNNVSSWSYWIKLDNLTDTPQCLWAKSSDTSGGRLNSFVSINSNNSINIWTSGVSSTVTNVPNSDYQQWIHIVNVFDGLTSQIKTYVNGNLIETNTATFTHSPTNVSPLFFGYNDVFSFPWYLRGKLDDVRIYNKILTNNEIQTLYNE